MELTTGTTLQNGTYRIEQKLGQGGFGITYKASMEMSIAGRLGNIKTRIDVALKEFFMQSTCMRGNDHRSVVVTTDSNRVTTDTFKQKFLKEARNMAKMKHPHIAQVLDVFEENGTAYYVLEYLDGGSLQDRMRQQRFSEADAVRFVQQIGSALQYMHEEHNMCHYDVKPSNIMLDKQGNAKLIDFGLAKNYDSHGNQTSSTPVGLSAGYAPLEQYQQQLSQQSYATDVYSLGATLYALAVGTPPPDAPTLVVNGMPQRPGHVAPYLWNAIIQAMQFNRQQRPQTIQAFLSLLTPSAVQPSPAQPLPTPSTDETLPVLPADNIIPSHPDDETLVNTPAANVPVANQPTPTPQPTPSSQVVDDAPWWKPLLIAAAIAGLSFILFI